MPTEIESKNVNSQSSSGRKNDIASMPMSDYNKHSTDQAKANELSNKLLTESANFLSKSSPNEFNIADLGCSHGKNSMECIKSALNGYLSTKEPVSVMVYLNDLPTNDFGEVFKCLNDPELSVYEHPLFEENPNSTISALVNGSSFNKQIFPKDHLNLSFSFNCLHWMEKPMKLSKGIIPKSCLSTSEENAAISKDAHEQLVRFLRGRAYELKSGGRFVTTIIKDFEVFQAFDKLWESFVESKGYNVNQFEPVNIPIYTRSTSEIDAVLDEVKDQFKIVLSQPQVMSGKGFSPDTFRAASINVLSRGIKESNVFTADDEIVSFVDAFYDSFPKSDIEVNGEYQQIVLERL